MGDLVKHRDGEVGIIIGINDGSLTVEELKAKYRLEHVGTIGSIRVSFAPSDIDWIYPSWLEVISEVSSR
jgi:hypothetical protein